MANTESIQNKDPSSELGSNHSLELSPEEVKDPAILSIWNDAYTQFVANIQKVPDYPPEFPTDLLRIYEKLNNTIKFKIQSIFNAAFKKYVNTFIAKQMHAESLGEVVHDKWDMHEEHKGVTVKSLEIEWKIAKLYFKLNPLTLILNKEDFFNIDEHQIETHWDYLYHSFIKTENFEEHKKIKIISTRTQEGFFSQVKYLDSEDALETEMVKIEKISHTAETPFNPLTEDTDTEYQLLKKMDLAKGWLSSTLINQSNANKNIKQIIYRIMKKVEGEPLSRILECIAWEERIDLNLKQILQIIIGICDELVKIHHFGYLHKDVQPSNIMIDMDDTKGTLNVTLIDFGQTKALDTNTKLAVFEERLVGNWQYMVGIYEADMMENGLTYISPKIDVYMLGILCYYDLKIRDEFLEKMYDPSPDSRVSIADVRHYYGQKLKRLLAAEFYDLSESLELQSSMREHLEVLESEALEDRNHPPLTQKEIEEKIEEIEPPCIQEKQFYNFFLKGGFGLREEWTSYTKPGYFLRSIIQPEPNISGEGGYPFNTGWRHLTEDELLQVAIKIVEKLAWYHDIGVIYVAVLMDNIKVHFNKLGEITVYFSPSTVSRYTEEKDYFPIETNELVQELGQPFLDKWSASLVELDPTQYYADDDKIFVNWYKATDCYLISAILEEMGINPKIVQFIQRADELYLRHSAQEIKRILEQYQLILRQKTE